MIKSFFKSNYKYTFIFIVSTIIGGALVAYGSYGLTPATDSLKSLDAKKFILWIVVITIASAGGRVLQFSAGYLFAKQEQEYFHSLRKKLINHYYESTPIDKLSNMQNRLTNDLKIISDQALDPVSNVVLCVVDLVFSAYVVLTFNFWLLCLILVLAVIMLYLPDLLSKQLEKTTNEVSSNYSKYIDTIEKWLAGLAVLQRYRSKTKLSAALARSSSGLEKATVIRDKKSVELRNLTYTANMFAQGAVLLATGLLVLNHQLTIGTLMSIVNFSSLIFSQLVNVTSQIGSIKSTRALADSVMKEVRELPNSEKKEDSLTGFDTLSTHGLALQYPNGEKIKYPDIQIKAGEKVLLSGDSGTGKSTLFKMILNEIKPTQGEIVFKDKRGKILTPDYSQIGYIPQDPVVFPGTIEDNITMFNSKLNKKAANWAQKVQLATDFEKFSDGIKTVVDLDKNNLSGGQRQKIILARTEVYNSKIILIDEGTSAIDSVATEQILKKILKEPATVIFIAHNLTDEMVQLFDRRINLSK